MKIKLILILWACLINSAVAGPYIEVGIGKNGIVSANNWEGRESTGARFGIGYVWEYSRDLEIDVSYQHFSQWTRGDGFDDRDEDTLDAIYITARWYF